MPVPERIKKIIDANVPPAMRDYYYRMVQKESSGDPNRGSSTGASGLLQFTRGTGKTYGLVGKDYDVRNDPEANIKAGVRLTEDNAKVLRRMLGREPTYSELAVAHQQGAETAGRMLLGTGNAPSHHLAVNNVPVNASGQEAARHIMNYYGFGGPNRKPGMTLNSLPSVLGNLGLKFNRSSRLLHCLGHRLRCLLRWLILRWRRVSWVRLHQLIQQRRIRRHWSPN